MLLDLERRMREKWRERERKTKEREEEKGAKEEQPQAHIQQGDHCDRLQPQKHNRTQKHQVPAQLYP